MQYKKHAEERATRGYGILETFLAKKRAAKTNSLIPDSKRSGNLLDVGCGSFPHFLQSVKFSKKFGVDSSIKQNLFKNSPITIKNIDIESGKLPFKDNFFNAVTMLAVFEHIDQDRLPFVLGEIHRILKKDGVFIITTPSPWSNLPLIALSYLGLVSKIEIDDHKHSMSPWGIKKILKESGFKNIKNGFFEAYFNMWFVAKK